MRDIKFIRDNLDTILNTGSTTGCFSAQNSHVALAGHSMGAYTVLAAAGTILEMPTDEANPPRLDLEADPWNFDREYQDIGGGGYTPADDYGAFVPADAYLIISGGMLANPGGLATINPQRVNLTGRDYVQDPMMLLTGTHDFLQDEDGVDGPWVVGQAKCYTSTSHLGMAGHSYGAVTTILAAGAVVDLGVGAAEEVLDLEEYGFSREHNDWGAFVPADAYMLLSVGKRDARDLALIDPSEPSMTGRDYIQKPLMALNGTEDMVPSAAYYLDPVTRAFGINDEPAYGVVVQDANHVTPVSRFRGWPSWYADPIMDFLKDGDPADYRDLDDLTEDAGEDLTDEEEDELFDEDFEDYMHDVFDDVFPEGIYTKAQEGTRLDCFKEYTLAFWDAHLSRNTTWNTSGLGFLDDPEATHEGSSTVADFELSPPTKAMFVRDSTGKPLAQFQSDGNLLLLECEETDVHDGQGTSITDTVDEEFIIQDSSAILLKVTSDGALYLKGDIDDEESTITPSANPEFIVQGMKEGVAVPRIMIGSDGNLELHKKVYTIDGAYAP